MRAETIVRLLRLSSPLARRPEHYHDEGGRERDPQVGEGGGGLAAGGVPAKKRKLNIDEGAAARIDFPAFSSIAALLQYSRKLALSRWWHCTLLLWIHSICERRKGEKGWKGGGEMSTGKEKQSRVSALLQNSDPVMDFFPLPLSSPPFRRTTKK